MARKGLIQRNEKRARTVERYAERRRELKAIVASPSSTVQEKQEAMRRLQRLPRDASPTRLRSRDIVDGRPRAVFRKFGISRIRFRDMAHRGELPGIRKSSW